MERLIESYEYVTHTRRDLKWRKGNSEYRPLPEWVQPVEHEEGF